MYPAPGAHTGDDGAAPAPAPSLPFRDGAARVGEIATMDGQNRVCLLKVAKPLGWDDATPLVVVSELGRITVRAGSPQTRRDAVAKYKAGRLTLSPAARGCLGVTSGSQLVMCTHPGGDAMVLMAGADVFQMLTGPAPDSAVGEGSPGLAAAG
jgi:hypothetical protein